MLQRINISFDIFILFITSNTLRGRTLDSLLILINKVFKINQIQIVYSEIDAIDICFKYLNGIYICFLIIDNVSESIKYIKMNYNIL